MVYTLFCLLQNECSVYYLQPYQKRLKSSYLGFSLFLSRLYADKPNRSHVHLFLIYLFIIYLNLTNLHNLCINYTIKIAK